MILYNLKKNKNKKMPNAYGKYYAYPVVTQTIGMDGLATHMSGHNTPFSPGAIKGMLTDMVICVRELALQGIAVKIDNLAIFSIGELMSDKLNLDATLKKATALAGDSSSDKVSPSTPSGGGTAQGGGSTPSGGGGTSQGGDTPSAGGDNPGGGEGE